MYVPVPVWYKTRRIISNSSFSFSIALVKVYRTKLHLSPFRTYYLYTVHKRNVLKPSSSGQMAMGTYIQMNLCRLCTVFDINIGRCKWLDIEISLLLECYFVFLDSKILYNNFAWLQFIWNSWIGNLVPLCTLPGCRWCA